MDQRPADYVSYLLRVWRSNGEDSSTWRASLENPHTGERMGFACLEDMFILLRQETSRTDGPELDEKDRENSR